MMITAGITYSHAVGVAPKIRWASERRGAGRCPGAGALGDATRRLGEDRAHGQEPESALLPPDTASFERVLRLLLAEQDAGDRLAEGLAELRVGLDRRAHAGGVELVDEVLDADDLRGVVLPDLLLGRAVAQRQRAGVDVPDRVLLGLGQPLRERLDGGALGLAVVEQHPRVGAGDRHLLAAVGRHRDDTVVDLGAVDVGQLPRAGRDHGHAVVVEHAVHLLGAGGLVEVDRPVLLELLGGGQGLEAGRALVADGPAVGAEDVAAGAPDHRPDAPDGVLVAGRGPAGPEDALGGVRQLLGGGDEVVPRPRRPGQRDAGLLEEPLVVDDGERVDVGRDRADLAVDRHRVAGRLVEVVPVPAGLLDGVGEVEHPRAAREVRGVGPEDVGHVGVLAAGQRGRDLLQQRVGRRADLGVDVDPRVRRVEPARRAG